MRTKAWPRRLLAALLALGVMLGALAAITAAASSRPTPMRTLWTATEPAPPPADFRVLQFPRAEPWVYSAPDGQPIRRLERALLNSLEESDQDWAVVRDADSTGWVRTADLTPQPPPRGASSEPVRRLVAAVRARSPGFELKVREPAPATIELSLSSPDEQRRWLYAVTEAGVQPRSYEYGDRMSKAVRDLRWLLPALLGVAALGPLTFLIANKALRRSLPA
jgi:hypothetical protein